MKTIKIIDLLNEMASNENYKPTFLFRGSIYKYNAETKYYEPSFMGLYRIFMILNDEVEIIKEIEKPKKIEKLKYRCGDFAWNLLKEQQEEIRIAVNYLLEKSKDNEI